ncbi:membrane protein [Microbacterium phage Zooman]|nr:membrane protein [Microbacterium phage Zooman]
MTALLIVLIALAVIFFGVGLAVEALKWLLIIAAILAAVAVITWLWRYITGKRKTNTGV